MTRLIRPTAKPITVNAIGIAKKGSSPARVPEVIAVRVSPAQPRIAVKTVDSSLQRVAAVAATNMADTFLSYIYVESLFGPTTYKRYEVHKAPSKEADHNRDHDLTSLDDIAIYPVVNISSGILNQITNQIKHTVTLS